MILLLLATAQAQVTNQVITVKAVAGTKLEIDLLRDVKNPDGRILFVLPVCCAKYGTGVFHSDNTKFFYEYEPKPNSAKSEKLTYAVDDPFGNRATIELNIIFFHGAPTAKSDEARVLINTVAKLDVAKNDLSPDGLPLRLSIHAPPKSGHAEIVIENGKNVIRYVPNPNFTGTDEIGYMVDDLYGASAQAVVNVTVFNNKPRAVSDVVTTLENHPIVIDALANDSEIDGQVLRLKNLEAPYFGTAEIINLNGTHIIKYTPKDGFAGSDSFAYWLDDGNGGLDKGKIVVTVQNNPPVALDDFVKTPIDGSIDIDVLANDASPDGRKIILEQVDAGKLGTTRIVETQDGQKVIRYAPLPMVVGTDTFNYELSDNNGGLVSGKVTVTIDSTKPPQKPIAAAN